MSILIPDMKMPPKGMRLFIAVNGCGDVYLITSGEEIITKYQPSAKAIELPPHGRLIDADALRRQWIEAESKNGGEMRLDELTLHDIITEGCVFDLDNAPTIIPAERGANNDG